MNKVKIVENLYRKSFNDSYDINRLIEVYGDKLIDLAFDMRYHYFNSDIFIDCFFSHGNCAYGNYMNMLCESSLKLLIEKSEFLAKYNNESFEKVLFVEVKKRIFQNLLSYGFILEIEVERFVKEYDINYLDYITGGCFVEEADEEITKETELGKMYKNFIEEIYNLAMKKYLSIQIVKLIMAYGEKKLTLTT